MPTTRVVLRWSPGILIAVLLLLLVPSHAITLRTSSKIPDCTKAKVFSFLSTPSNWPTIVLSSWDVAGSAVDRPLKAKDEVDEIFGLPPILPLAVSWECIVSDASRGILDVASPQGVPGLASDCRMLFQVDDDCNGDEASTRVLLTMEYRPRSILGRLAAPVLIIDNFLALRVLLPNALRQPVSRLEEFRTLMGTLYGIAGLLHLADCLLGPSQLLVQAGFPSFYNLSTIGQLLVLVWCAVGPLAFWLSRNREGDLGLLTYGLTEVVLAAVATQHLAPPTEAAVVNAVVVQAVVLASWVYCHVISGSQEPKSNEN